MEEKVPIDSADSFLRLSLSDLMVVSIDVALDFDIESNQNVNDIKSSSESETITL